LAENVYACETGSREDADELCFQQSTGNSNRPQVDVSKRAVGQYFADHDVRQLYAPATFQHPCDLADSPRFVWYEIEYAIRDHDIDRCVLDWQIHRIAVPDIDVREAARLSA
jgi:hypothetical protein